MVSAGHLNRIPLPARLLIFLAILSLPLFWFAYVFISAKMGGEIRFPGGYIAVDLKPLGNFPLDQISGTIADVPARWRALDGKRVSLEGFMFSPNATADRVSDFQLVYDLYNHRMGPPLVQDRVFVNVPHNGTVKYDDGLVRVEGTLHVHVRKGAGSITSVYTLDLDKLTPNSGAAHD